MENSNIIINSNAKDGLKQLQDNSVDCIVTSPPYWGLRDYGVEEQLGLEATPEEFVNNLCDIFDEAHRVLKEDGTLWLNIGDTYANGKGRKSQVKQSFENTGEGKYGELLEGRRSSTKGHSIIKDKDLVGIPWRVAFELQRRGWYLRQDIIWAKPNPMPESVKDRCTKSHEHIFLLSKSPKYYFDFESIKEPAVSNNKSNSAGYPAVGGKKAAEDTTGKFQTRNRKAEKTKSDTSTRRKRDVWSVAVKPFKEAHFAVFPEELIKPCVLAGSPPEGVVLDPFFGAGTTAVVAKKNNRNYIGIEINKEYIKIANKRLNNTDNQTSLF